MSEMPTNQNPAAAPKGQRKPYIQPQLRALGAVQELTLGAAMTTIEAINFKAM